MIRDERGSSLLEVLIALAILGLISAAFLMALSAAPRALLVADQRAVAAGLARSQMEHVRTLPPGDGGGYHYEGAFRVKTVVYPYFGREGLETITVTVSHHDDEIITLEGFKLGP